MKIFKKFESITQFNNYLENGKHQPLFSNSSETNTESFTGTKNYSEANDLLLYGDKELQKKIDDSGVKKLRLDIQRTAARRQFRSSVVGAFPNVAAYISGTPNSMITIENIKTNKKVLTIGYSLAVSGSVDKNDIIEASAKLIQALLIIEASGVRINLYSVFHAESRNHQIGFGLKIKTSGQHLDTLKMAYPLAHSSMLRRHCFKFEEVTEGVPMCFSSGYGRAVSNSNKIKEFCKENGLNLDACCNFYEISNNTPKNIAKMLINQVTK